MLKLGGEVRAYVASRSAQSWLSLVRAPQPSAKAEPDLLTYTVTVEWQPEKDECELIMKASDNDPDLAMSTKETCPPPRGTAVVW